MTSERAAEIAGGLRFQYAMSNAAHDAIKDAILRACKEQREADARIAENCVVAKPCHATREGRKPPKPSMLRIEIAAAIRGAE